MKHVWTIICGKDNLWLCWVHAKYIRGQNFWEIKATGSSYWGWRSILKVREFAKSSKIHAIGDGTSTKFWLDPWTKPGYILIEQFEERAITDLGLGRELFVSALISNGIWSLPTPTSDVLVDIWHLIYDVCLVATPPTRLFGWLISPVFSALNLCFLTVQIPLPTEFLLHVQWQYHHALDFCLVLLQWGT